ncbi:hypothetical protein [Cellulomonas sp. PS-H5]|uniref:hypothetical protein n=1 Tax=Cellulomonas sp. PS-H5 TaxID=2820400 RepID=UPI001C4EEFDA|nr:hypothetical protein [Cellulomonas sp. PS-H5]MBW0255577.1 hypothetical protein [Cellulomonas sp. PS-H5]
MRRTTRTTVGVITAAVMALTIVGPAQASSTAARDARQDAEATAGLLAEVTLTESLLAEVGLSLLDFADVEQRSPEFLAELERLLDDWEPEPDPEPEVEPSPTPEPQVVTPPILGQHLQDGPITPGTTLGSTPVSIPVAASDTTREQLAARWLAHAYTMAEVNSARDRNARDIGSETVYMYLSHYVDLPQDPTQYPVDHNSNANRYAAWITPDDRRVFDQYLRYDRHVEMAYQVTQLGEALRGLTGVQGAARHAWQNAHRWGGKILGLTSVGWNAGVDGVSGQEATAVLTDAWNATDDPEAAIRMVEEGLKSQYGTAIGTKEMTGLMLAAAATVAGAPVGLVAALVTTSLTVSLAGMKDVVDQAMLAGLLATASSRVTLRYFRSIGMD